MSRAVDEAARQLAGEVEVLRAENERLRAALVDPLSFAEAWRALDYSYGTDALEQVRFGWDMAIGALRARAGLTDLEAAEVNRGQGDEGAQAQPPGAAAAPTGQAGGEQSGSAGPPAGPCCEGARRIESDPGDATELMGWWCPEHGKTRRKKGAAATDVACRAHGMGQEGGAADERAAIVGFLRRWFERPAYAGAHAWMLAGTREALAAIERGEHQTAAGSSTATSSPTADAPNAGPAMCRKCGAPAAWILDAGTYAWFQECLLGTGCNGGPFVVSAPVDVAPQPMVVSPAMFARLTGAEPPSLPAPVSCRCFHAPEQHHDNKLAAGWGRCAEDGCDCPGWRP